MTIQYILRKIGFFPVLLAVLLFISGCGGTRLVKSSLQHPVAVDGRLEEWHTESFIDAYDGIINLGMTSQDGFYYIAGTINDEIIAGQVYVNGFNLWISPSGDKKKELLMEAGEVFFKKINYHKGGFFAILTDSQKVKALRSLDSLKQGIRIINKKENGIYNVLDGSFSSGMYFNRNALSFEVKLPIQSFNAPGIYGSIGKNSIFCLEFKAIAAANDRGKGSFLGLLDGPQSTDGEEQRQPDDQRIPEIWFSMDGDAL